MKLDAILEAYQVDMAHARQVADHALVLFDGVAEQSGLPADGRRLLEIGALLHNVGLTTDPPNHHLVGRDIVLRQPLAGLSRREQATVACLVALHRKKARPKSEPACLELGKRQGRLARSLAAILRVADGLDYSQSQTTRIEQIVCDAEGVLLRLTGPLAPADAERAVAKADLWQQRFGTPLRVELGEVPPPDPARPPAAEQGAASLVPWYAQAETPLAELTRVILRRYLRRMRLAEREIGADRSGEAVHDLRVATRRLRAALRLAAPLVPGRELQRFVKGVRRIAGAASSVRDHDVLIADLGARVSTLPAEDQPGAAALNTALAASQAAALADLHEFLNSDAQQRFMRAFATWMNHTDGWNEHSRVRDLAGSTIWRAYEALRAHERGGLPGDPSDLHAMRIAAKRLRYLIELFGDSFGPRVDLVVEPLVAFQDHAGALNDVAVAGALMTELAGADTAALAASQSYLALRAHDAARLAEALPTRWDKIASATYRRNLMGLIVKL